MSKINVLSLFDGMAGARVALDRLGIECNYYASEVDKYAIKIAKKNYPDIKHLGCIKDIKAKDLPPIDLLIGGSPCQDLSVAKPNRKGLKGEKSSLFYEYVRLLRECKPRYFLLENVASMGKESRDIITKELGSSPIKINAALVSAQNRKRYYWTNFLVFPPVDRGILLKDIILDGNPVKGCAQRTYPRKPVKGMKREKRTEVRKDEKANALTSAQTDSMVLNPLYLTEAQVEKIKFQKGAKVLKRNKDGFKYKYQEGSVKFPQDLADKSQTLTTSCGNHGRGTTYIKQPVKNNCINLNVAEEPCKSDGCSVCSYFKGQGGDSAIIPPKPIKIGHLGQDKRPDRIYSTEGKSVTLCGNAGGQGAKTGLYYTHEGIRKLHPIECERLQGLPDNYTEGVSNTQRYKMTGNGYCVPKIEHILSFIKEDLTKPHN